MRAARKTPWSSALVVLVAGCGGESTGPVVPLEFAAVRTAFFRTCGLTTPGAVYCWGIQELTTDESDSIIYTTPRRVGGTGGLEFAALDIAGNYACGVTVAGAAYCWGGKYSNFAGALGIGSMDTSAHRTPRAVLGGHVFEDVTTGGTHTCGRTTGGSVYCWGNNEIGQLGDGTTMPRDAPVLVLGGHTFRAVSAGAVTTCALTNADDAYCWGSGLQLGNGTTTHDPGSSTPVPVSGGHKFTSFSVGESATCAVTTGGAGYCWGRYDNLGGGAMTTSSTPAAVAAGIMLVTISVSPFHTCGVATNAAAYCWGYNDNGQLGNGTMTGTLTPQLVSGGLSFASVDARGFHTCGITTDTLAYCWGSGYVGVLGDGSRTDRTTPVRVSGQ